MSAGRVFPHRIGCPHCGRVIATGRNGRRPAHYNPRNPPLLGAWYGCPGPTDAQKRRADEYMKERNARRQQ